MRNPICNVIFGRGGITPAIFLRAREFRLYFAPPALILIILVSACSRPQTGGTSAFPSFVHTEDNQLFVIPDQISLLIDGQGDPVSTKITQDESLGTVHTFDLLPIIVFTPTRSNGDGLWRVNAWVSSGNSVSESGYLVSIVLGYDDTVVEYGLLPGYVFEYKSGKTEAIADIVSELKVGDQIFVHVIGEHSFTEEEMVLIEDLGFDYPRLVEGHEEENMAILNALIAGKQPPDGEIRGVGLIYRGTE